MRTGSELTSGDENGLRTDELGFEVRLPVLEKHGDNFFQVGLQLFEARPLTVSASETRDIPYIQARFSVPFDDRRV